jgi:hypothetical protein
MKKRSQPLMKKRCDEQTTTMIAGAFPEQTAVTGSVNAERFNLSLSQQYTGWMN